MNRIFIVPILALFLILIPTIGIFLTVIVIVLWGIIKYDSIYEVLTAVNIKHDVEKHIKETKTMPEINTKKYKRGELSESEMEQGK